MPVLGTGVFPTGGVNSLGQELQYVVRRGFVKKLVVQLYNTSPLAAALIANSQPASGGVSSVTIPAQGSQFVNLQWVGYDGSFNQPAVQPAVTNLEFNLKGCESDPGSLHLGFEGLIQDAHEIHPPSRRAHERRRQCGLLMGLATALLNNVSNTTQIIGLPAAVDDGTNSTNYGNQSRTTNPWLRKPNGTRQDRSTRPAHS